MAMQINQKIPIRNLDRILGFTGKEQKNCGSMMGVAYRSEVDDTRFSASEIFYRQARTLGMQVEVHDPRKILAEFSIQIDNSLPEADAFDLIVFVCLTNLSFNKFFDLVKDASPCVYDCDNVLTHEQLNN